MHKHRSSIFSSETLDSRSIPKAWWLSIAFAAFIVAASELLLRLLIGSGISSFDYWTKEAGIKYEWYREQRVTPDYVVIGDSTAARNFDSIAIEAELQNEKVFNLGTPGNFPLALQATAFTVLKNRPAPKVVVLSQIPHSFYESEYVSSREALIINSRATRHLNQNLYASDYLVLTRAYDHRFRILKILLGREDSDNAPPLQGFMPDKRPPAPRLVPDRYTSSAEPSSKRLDSVLHLARLASESGFKLIVTLPVQLDIPAQPRVERHWRWLQEKSKEYGFAILDMRTLARFEHNNFTDTFHLNPAGAKKQSEALGRAIGLCLGKQQWRSCLADRERQPVDLVSDPGWYFESTETHGADHL